MAFDVKKTDHLFIPFNRFGFALRDSKNNTKVYKDRKTLERYNTFRTGEKPYETTSTDYVDVVEYAPVVHGRWDTASNERAGTLTAFTHYCPICNYLYKDLHFKGHNFCPNCGAKMDK